VNIAWKPFRESAPGMVTDLLAGNKFLQEMMHLGNVGKEYSIAEMFKY
jgi:hypothetical protein